MVGPAEGVTAPSCAACDLHGQDSSCKNSFAARGVAKVHWECWSLCNLGCKFCYRTLGSPLNTVDAKRLLDAIAFSGAEAVVFAGGDPTLRPDLPTLLAHARHRGLLVEVQTNAHYMPSATQVALLGSQTDLIGVSIDGSTAKSHDTLRSTRGNFRKVLSFLGSCDRANKPVIVRTLINRQNRDEVSEIGKVIAGYGNVIRWSLLEFTPIGAGYDNEKLFGITRSEYVEAVQRGRAAYTGNARIEAYEGPAKVGTYALITPEGQLYGTSAAVDGRYPLVGGMLDEHLTALAQSLPFDLAHHHARYGSNALAPELDTWLPR